MYDVAIIGGGPAGSTAATLLARAGRRVIVFERQKFPRFHIGESLLPFSIQTFDRLGVREKLDRTFLPKFGGEIMAACGTRGIKFYFKDGFRSQRDRAYQVTRSDFDKLLLDHSRENGAEVLEETEVKAVDSPMIGSRSTLKIPRASDRQSKRAICSIAAEDKPCSAAFSNSRRLTTICRSFRCSLIMKMSIASRVAMRRSSAWCAGSIAGFG
jgi:2-polyprenyl-6-methoxyphenol hydroxylase-like FAD-dependent oxidoreductase